MADKTKPNPPGLDNFDTLPAASFVRPTTVAAIYGVSMATVWRWAASGRIPKPVKLGPNTTAWNVGTLRNALAGVAQ